MLPVPMTTAGDRHDAFSATGTAVLFGQNAEGVEVHRRADPGPDHGHRARKRRAELRRRGRKRQRTLSGGRVFRRGGTVQEAMATVTGHSIPPLPYSAITRISVG
jgi:hypothetical protein